MISWDFFRSDTVGMVALRKLDLKNYMEFCYKLFLIIISDKFDLQCVVYSLKYV